MIYQHQLSTLVLDHLHDIYMCLRCAFEPVYQSLLVSCLSMPMSCLPASLSRLCYGMCYSCGCRVVEALVLWVVVLLVLLYLLRVVCVVV
jgi:hypothetical protein